VPCPVTACQERILFKNIDLHIREDHKESIPLNKPEIGPYLREASLNARKNNWVLFTYQESGVQFYFVFVKRNKHWYSWVSIKGGPEVASAWVFAAKAKNDENKMAVEFSGGFVHPIDSSVEEVIDSGQYLLLNRSSVEKLQVASQKAALKGFHSSISIAYKIDEA